MHEEGVWTLAADEEFQTVYSSGRDKKVYAIELNQGIYRTTCMYMCIHTLCIYHSVE